MTPIWKDLSSWAALGGFLGLVSFVFTLWDRLIRFRPIAWVVAKHNDFACNPCLRVKNSAATHILVRRLRSSNPAVFRVGERETIGAAARASVDDAALVMLAPDEEKDFPLWRQPGKTSGHISFTVSWRAANWTWLPQVPKSAWTTLADVDRMVKACEREQKAREE